MNKWMIWGAHPFFWFNTHIGDCLWDETFSWVKNDELDPGIEESDVGRVVRDLAHSKAMLFWILLCWSLGWFYQRSLAEKMHFFRHKKKRSAYSRHLKGLWKSSQDPPRHLTTSTSHPYLHFYLKSWGHKGLDFVYHDLLGCQPLACSQPLRPSCNPRFTAPLSSCCAIVLAGSVGVTRCMVCNG